MNKFNKIKNLIFNSIGIAMGVSVAVLNIFNKIDIKTSVKMLALGLFCISLSILNQKGEK